MGLRAILGQQVTVKAATTIACRFVEAFGEPIVTPFAGAESPHPAPARVAAASVDDIARHGIVAARCQEHHRAGERAGIGRAVPRRRRASQSGRLHQAAGRAAGIGPWTAHYIAMRALRWPDAFPEGRHRRAQQPRWRDGEGGGGCCRKPGGRGAAMPSCNLEWGAELREQPVERLEKLKNEGGGIPEAADGIPSAARPSHGFPCGSGLRASRGRSCSHDRRVKLVILTRKGNRARAELLKEFHQPPPEFAALDREDLEALHRLLTKLAPTDSRRA